MVPLCQLLLLINPFVYLYWYNIIFCAFSVLYVFCGVTLFFFLMDNDYYIINITRIIKKL